MIMQMIGANYYPWTSSSGKIPPKNFKWSSDQGEVVVYFDGAIQRVIDSGVSIKTKEKTFGWTSESPALISGTIDDIYNRIDLYKTYFNTIFTYSDKLISLDSHFFKFCFAGSNLPWTPESEQKVYEKTKLVSILCSNNRMTSGHTDRINIAKSFEDRVDCYGDLFNKRIGGSGHYHHNKKTEALKDYMFSITMENCIYDTYFTEKITDCFANGVIPVYRGTENIDRFFYKEGIIFLDDKFALNDLSYELYLSKLTFIQKNFDIIQNITNADDYLFNEIKKLLD